MINVLVSDDEVDALDDDDDLDKIDDNLVSPVASLSLVSWKTSLWVIRSPKCGKWGHYLTYMACHSLQE